MVLHKTSVHLHPLVLLSIGSSTAAWLTWMVEAPKQKENVFENKLLQIYSHEGSFEQQMQMWSEGVLPEQGLGCDVTVCICCSGL